MNGYRRCGIYNIYTMEHYSVIIKNEILQSVTKRMGPDGIMLSETSQREKRQMYDFTYLWNLKNKINEQA